MTKKERLAFLERARELEMDLPEGTEIIGVSVCGSGYIHLSGESLNFRRFAGSKGAEVQSYYLPKRKKYKECIRQSAVLFGCETIYLLYPNNPVYEQELARCPRP